jgi:Ca2+:H+ antiporter
MLIMAIIGALSPTLFYQFFGSVSYRCRSCLYKYHHSHSFYSFYVKFELHCTGCPETADQAGSIACSNCYYDQMNPSDDPVYQNSVKPFMWIII